MECIQAKGVVYEIAWDCAYHDERKGVVTVAGLEACPTCGDTPIRWDVNTMWLDSQPQPCTTIFCAQCDAQFDVFVA